MLQRAKQWTAILALLVAAACGDGSESASDAHSYTEVEFEVPQGSGPEKDADKEECTTSCSLAKHPVPPFTELDFEMARAAYAAAVPESENAGLESLLFYGPKTASFLAELGHGALTEAHRAVLARELSRDEAVVTLRLVGEEDGRVHAMYGPTPVPIGKKQHLATVGEGLLAMEFNGTVMRTGVNYLWSRYWVEAEHFGAGPWFTVMKSGSDWQVLDHITMSDGAEQSAVRVEIKMTLEDVK